MILGGHRPGSSSAVFTEAFAAAISFSFVSAYLRAASSSGEVDAFLAGLEGKLKISAALLEGEDFAGKRKENGIFNMLKTAPNKSPNFFLRHWKKLAIGFAAGVLGLGVAMG